MCHPKRCRTCGLTTWAGCGSHVAQVKARVPADQWCSGHAPAADDSKSGWLRRALGAKQ